MGPRGGAGGCWCMLWRLRKRDYEAMKGDANRDAIRAVVTAGPPPGLLAYAGDTPVGWLPIAPRQGVPRLAAPRELRAVADRPVSSVTCFLIAYTARRTGYGRGLRGATRRPHHGTGPPRCHAERY